MKQKNYTISVFEDADAVIKQVMVASINDFRNHVTRVAQQEGKIADPHVYYDEATRTLFIKQYPEDKGTVMIKEKGNLKLVPYKKVSHNANYAQLDPMKGCYSVYVKRAKGIDHPVNVALDEDRLIEIFDEVNHESLLEQEKEISEAKARLEVVKDELAEIESND